MGDSGDRSGLEMALRKYPADRTRSLEQSSCKAHGASTEGGESGSQETKGTGRTGQRPGQPVSRQERKTGHGAGRPGEEDLGGLHLQAWTQPWDSRKEARSLKLCWETPGQRPCRVAVGKSAPGGGRCGDAGVLRFLRGTPPGGNPEALPGGPALKWVRVCRQSPGPCLGWRLEEK